MGYNMIPEGDEEELKNAVGTVGPVSVAFNVMDSFYDYSEGNQISRSFMD